MRGVSGASGAGEIFAGIVNELGEANGKVIPNESIAWIRESSGVFPNDTITISAPLNGTKYRRDDGIPTDRQDVTVKYWSKTHYEKVTVTLIPTISPDSATRLTD